MTLFGPKKRVAVTVLVLATLFTRRVAADDATVSVKLKVNTTFWRCAKPQSVSCTSLAQPEIDACKECKEWEMVTAIHDLAGTLHDALYIDRRKPANQFLHDLLTDVYRVSPTIADCYTPPRIALLYEHPRDYGWVRIPWPTAGSIFIDRQKVAFATEDLPQPTGRHRGPITLGRVLRDPTILFTLVYPSAKNDGKLTLTEGRYLFPKGGIALLPDFLIDTPAPETEQDFTLDWNAWFEGTPAPTYVPVPHLQPNKTYHLLVHLAPFGYPEEAPEEVSVPARSAVKGRITQMARESQARAMKLSTLLLTDETFLQPAGSATHELTVDLERLRAWEIKPSRPEGNVLAALAKHTAPRFVIAEAVLPVQTSTHEGRTTIGLSIWNENAWPIDEISIPVCIATPEHAQAICTRTGLVQNEISGFDAFRPATGTPPDAAVHLVSLAGGNMTGVFHRHDVPGAPYVAWKINLTEAEFLDHAAAIMSRFATAQQNAGAVARAGEQLYGLLFAQNDPGNALARRAQAMFEAYTRPHMARRPVGAEAPSLFFRFVATTPVRHPKLLPFALAKATSSTDAFLGFHFRIEVPLAQQSVTDDGPCISQWELAIPSHTDPELGAVRDRLDDRLPSWMTQAHVQTIGGLRDWLATDKTDDRPTALIVLSHATAPRGVTRLFVDEQDDLGAEDLRRVFSSSSLAILNGCGTAEVGADDLTNTLNTHGVDAVIATFHQVSTAMAVDYFDCLAGQLSTNGDTAIDAVHFQALQCLSTRRPAPDEQPYGAAALAYGLAGNPHVRLCPPRKSP